MRADMRPDVVQRLRELHEHYVFLVNSAVEDGRREDEIEAIAASYPDEAAQLMADATRS
ncbi:hypothetical protein [Pseudonocardia spinosispora]|uniref:hypothetical protein n=1 Tax=Pseudonocardia spinosispora TaxID=103441 RepID=UPI00041C5A36|nr:hypothetical protein [Pseudonocardia spinosispora]